MAVNVITLTADTSQIVAALEHIAQRIAELKEQAAMLRAVDAEINAAADEVIAGLERMEMNTQ